MSVDPAQAFLGAVWFDVLSRSNACPTLPSRVLLHAGPPFRGTPPAPVVNAAIQAVLFEGWVNDARQAHALIAAGGVEWRAAQDHGVATPLAQVVSASMPVAAIRLGGAVRYGALLEGAPPALRFGSTAAACRDRLEALRSLLIDGVAPLLQDTPLPLADPIRRGIVRGDDGHARTGAITDELITALPLRAALRSTLCAMTAFALPLLMAAASAALAERGTGVAAMGGNGVEFGLRCRGDAAWRRIASAPPRGSLLPGCEAADPLPAVGDSVLIDYCGLGGLIDAPALRAALLDPSSGIVDRDRIMASGEAPIFNLAMLDATGAMGLIGRGTYRPDVTLFC